MNKKDIIIIPNEELVEIPNGVYYESFDSEIGHTKKMIDFCNNHNISINSTINDPSQICAFELSAMGHIVALIENNLIIFFISNEVSYNQMKWFKDSYRRLNRFEIKGFVYDDENVVSIKADGVNVINPLKELNNIIKKKYKNTRIGDDRCIKN